MLSLGVGNQLHIVPCAGMLRIPSDNDKHRGSKSIAFHIINNPTPVLSRNTQRIVSSVDNIYQSLAN